MDSLSSNNCLSIRFCTPFPHTTTSQHILRFKSVSPILVNSPLLLFNHSLKCKTQQTSSTDHTISYRSKHQNSNGLLGCFGLSRKLVSGIMSSYLICLTLVGEAYTDPYPPLRYSCEDAVHYYNSVDHKEGESLLIELNSIISKHRSLSYKQVWEALKILDAADIDNPEASSNVVDIYSSKVVSKLLAGKPEGWNREHLWPRSYGITDGPSFTDLYNIRPADVNVNSSRGNKYYGECVAHSTDCVKPANSEAAFDTETDKLRWAPPLQVRGDIARALMYMAVCYGFNQSDGRPNLHLSDSPSRVNREMGLLSTLLKWNELDPPSKAERLRNDRVCQLYQHNRNPFVDHPEYANFIWKAAIPGNWSTHIPSKAWINEFHYDNKGKDQNEFVLHNWDNERCLVLLKNCYEALPNHGKVIVVDSILPLIPMDNVLVRLPCQEEIVVMALTHGGKERTTKEFEALAVGAGFVGFKLVCSSNIYWIMEFTKTM